MQRVDMYVCNVCVCVCVFVCARARVCLPAAEFRFTPSRVRRPVRRASTEAKQAAPEELIL
jgi:hypothetical protein